VAESRSPRDGKFVAQIGTFDPKMTGADGIKVDKVQALEWIAKGATCTETTRVILEKAGILEKKKPSKTQSKPKPVDATKNKNKKEK
jgi:small subunit ribosomal protein S16